MSEKQYTLPRGMKDIEPDEMAKRIWLSDKIRDVLWSYGFQMLEPSPVENLETLEAKSGPGVREEIYWFKDKADRDLGLRFDLTVGMTRMVANRFDLPEPIKIASIGGVWRYDEPQFARYRYHTQWDAEIYGVAEPSADAEIIALASDILDKVGLKEHEVRVSNRKLAEGFLQSIDVRGQEELERILRIIDSIAKKGREKVEGELSRAGLSESKVKRVIGFADIAGKPDEVLSELEKKLPKNDLIQKGQQELRGTIENMDSLGKTSKVQVDLGIVRGISYYDGTVFEAYDQVGEDVGAVFGGGRFDKLCRIYGKRDMPATGVAGGFERLMLSLEKKVLFPDIDQNLRVFVAMTGTEVRKETIKVLQMLREAGIRSDRDLKERPLRKQMEYAAAINARLVVVVGPREIKEGKIRLRDMKTGQEKEVERRRIVDEMMNVRDQMWKNQSSLSSRTRP
jgi:histidyl-tRNA synthetase